MGSSINSLSKMWSYKYKSVKQNDTNDCAAACIATVLKQYKSKMHISKIREIAGTDLRGTNALGIVRCLKALNFETKAVEANLELFNDNGLPLPAIAHVVKDGMLLHFVVVHAVRKKHLIISDPAEGLIKISKKAFGDMWTGVIIFAVPTDAYEEFKEESSFFSLLKILFLDKKLIFHIVISALMATIVGILTSFYLQMLIDSIIPRSTLFNLNILSAGVIALFIFQAVFELAKNYLLVTLGNRMSIRLMLGYYNHVLKLNFSFFETRKSGEIISRFMDANKVINALASATLTIILDVSMVVVIGIVLYFQNPKLFGLTLLCIPFYAVIILIFVRSYEKLNRKEMESNSILNSYIIESLNGIETIKALQAEEAASKKVDTLFVNNINAAFKSFNIDNIQTFLKTLLQTINSVFILWVGSSYVISGELGIGQLITFNVLVNYFATPLQNIINLQSQIQTAKVASDRINEIMILTPEMNEQNSVKIDEDFSFSGDLQFQKVHFSYPMRRECLTDINFKIGSGEKVAFVGESGSGKSTIAKLLLSYYDTSAGKITFDNYDINDIDKRALRSNITLVPQTNFFFSGTIYENLLFGIDQSVRYEDVVKACKDACIDEFIDSLPLKYNSVVEENAVNYSGGQKQRLAIARALLRQASVMILDEASSNIDGFTEHKIFSNLMAKDDLTLIIIAHRLSVIQNCTKIFVLDQNRIVEEGKHNDLIKENGLYSKMWNSML